MLTIRDESSGDHARVFELQQAAFGREEEAKIAEVLRTAEPHLSLVAEQDGRVVGHVMFSPVTLSGDDAPPAAALGPVGVDPSHQGRGVGSALIREGLARCPDHGWQAVFLVGNPRYYERFGFVLAGPLGFRYGDPVMEPAFQRKELRAGALAGCRGRVRFHPAFGQDAP